MFLYAVRYACKLEKWKSFIISTFMMCHCDDMTARKHSANIVLKFAYLVADSPWRLLTTYHKFSSRSLPGEFFREH